MSAITIPQVGLRAIEGAGIRHADSGSSAKPVIVLTSPWPESVYAEFLGRRLPAGRVVIIDAGQFVWEDEPARYASAIRDSITAGRS